MSSTRSSQKSRKDDEELFPYFESLNDLSLSRINGEINKMHKNVMVQLLKKNGLNSKGVKEVLNRRLKNFYRKQRAHLETVPLRSQYYEHFVVIDFEATCEKINGPQYVHEIIEFPAILIDADTGNVIDQFHSYCRPTLNPILSEFCVSLTGISQNDVNTAPEFPRVFERFERWLKDRNLHSKKNAAFVTDGPWDFSRFLNLQCAVSDIGYPKWAKRWVNVKKVFGNFYKINRPKLEVMLSNLGFKFQGRLHCGLDDAKNIAKIVARMIEDGCVIQVNERLNDGRLESITEREREKMYRHIALASPADDAVSRNQDSDKENAVLPAQDVRDKEIACVTGSLSGCTL